MKKNDKKFIHYYVTSERVWNNNINMKFTSHLIRIINKTLKFYK